MENIKRYLSTLKNVSHTYFQNTREKMSQKFSRLSAKEQIFFIKRLSFLTKSGIPILDSLLIIESQTKKKEYKKLLGNFIHDVSNGQSLGRSLDTHNSIFPDFVINMISFGESTGMLSENLEYIAIEMKKKLALKKKIIAAFTYPLIVCSATIGITAFLMVYLLPKITPVFKSLNIKLPLTTRIVIEISNIIRHDARYIILFFIVFFSAFFVLKKKYYSFTFFCDSVILRVPIVGNILRSYNLAGATRTFGLLLKSGITESEAMPIVIKNTQNSVYKKAFVGLEPIIEKGEKISVYIESLKNIFPSMISHIIAVGEKSGNLSNSFMYLSELYEEEVDDFTKNLGTLIEPILMIGMGLIVGFIAISIITPIYGITQNLHP